MLKLNECLDFLLEIAQEKPELERLKKATSGDTENRPETPISYRIREKLIDLLTELQYIEGNKEEDGTFLPFDLSFIEA